MSKSVKSWKEFWNMLAESHDPIAATDRPTVSAQTYKLYCADIINKLSLDEDDVLLDIGCGTGLIDAQLAGNVRHIIATDFSFVMARKARLNTSLCGNVDVVACESTALPLKDKIFSKVLVYAVAQYLNSREIGLMLKELHRITRSGGMIMLGEIPRTRDISFLKRIQDVLIHEGLRGLIGKIFKFFLERWFRLTGQWTHRFIRPQGPSEILHSQKELLDLAHQYRMRGRVLARNKKLPWFHQTFDLLIENHPFKQNGEAALVELTKSAPMTVRDFTSERREEWNAFVAKEPSFALLQSWEWGEFKEKLNWKAFRIAVEDKGCIIAGAQMLIKPLPTGIANVAYVPRGPVGTWLENGVTPRLLSRIHHIARCHRVIFLKIEPPLLNNAALDEIAERHFFRASPVTNQPRSTIIVNLAQDLDQIFAQIHKGTRRKIRDAGRKGVTIQLGDRDDLADFHKLMSITGQRANFVVRQPKYYEDQWQVFAHKQQTILLKAIYQDRLIAMSIGFYFGNHAALFHLASSGDHANLNANSLLIWEGIKWAKSKGCCTYDLWGIPNKVGQAAWSGKDPQESARTDDLWGVYCFKKLFSKNIVFYTGAYDFVYQPILYKLITNRLLNTNTLDQFSVWLDSRR